MKHLDLFSGIGGFALAARWMGWETVGFCEIDPFCQRVLKKHWPNVPIHNDIKTLKPNIRHGEIDIITGGFPCQPFSHAGKRKGKKDDRYLWPEMLRAIWQFKPRWIVGENVAGLFSMENGSVLERILLDLETSGYRVETFGIPACGVEAWHRRERVWIVGYTEHNGSPSTNGERKEIEPPLQEGEKKFRKFEGTGSLRSAGQNSQWRSDPNTSRTNTNQHGSHRAEVNEHREVEFQDRQDSQPGSMGKDVPHTQSKGLEISEESEQQQSVHNAQRADPWDGAYWAVEPSVGRVANGIPNRVDRLKGLGNAIVPQVAYEIFKAIDIHQ